jgi:hypothetical protein
MVVLEHLMYPALPLEVHEEDRCHARPPAGDFARIELINAHLLGKEVQLRGNGRWQHESRIGQR